MRLIDRKPHLVESPDVPGAETPSGALPPEVVIAGVATVFEVAPEDITSRPESKSAGSRARTATAWALREFGKVPVDRIKELLGYNKKSSVQTVISQHRRSIRENGTHAVPARSIASALGVELPDYEPRAKAESESGTDPREDLDAVRDTLFTAHEESVRRSGYTEFGFDKTTYHLELTDGELTYEVTVPADTYEFRLAYRGEEMKWFTRVRVTNADDKRVEEYVSHPDPENPRTIAVSQPTYRRHGEEQWYTDPEEIPNMTFDEFFYGIGIENSWRTLDDDERVAVGQRLMDARPVTA